MKAVAQLSPFQSRFGRRRLSLLPVRLELDYSWSRPETIPHPSTYIGSRLKLRLRYFLGTTIESLWGVFVYRTL